MRYEVPGMTLIPQQLNMSCWYASAQMVIRWKSDKFQMSFANLIPPDLDAECRKIRDGNAGITNAQIVPMARRLGLVALPPMSPTLNALLNWLQMYGPLWVNGKTHIVVIAGIDGMNVKVYDPGPVGVGGINWRSLRDWYAANKPLVNAESSRDTGADVQTVFLHCP